jgi:ABC-type Na+ efflux pump permease subunit
MYRTWVILRHTFRESMVQPIYSLLIGLGVAVITIFAFLPFFTLGEDTVMFMSVSLDVILLLVLIATLFATSKSIFDEIEDRTMLTLMSKPLHKWEVLVGKYLGIILAALVAVVLLGGVLCVATYMRIPGDYLIRRSLDDRELAQLFNLRQSAIVGLIPNLIMIWLAISVLAAVGVALSTRFSLVVNLPVVIFVYVAGNLTRFLYPLTGPDAVLQGRSVVVKGLATVIRLFLPYLEAFDLKARTIHSPIAIGQFVKDSSAVPLSVIVEYLGLSALYAAAFVTFALSVGMLMFQTRELGGAEG